MIILMVYLTLVNRTKSTGEIYQHETLEALAKLKYRSTLGGSRNVQTHHGHTNIFCRHFIGFCVTNIRISSTFKADLGIFCVATVHHKISCFSDHPLFQILFSLVFRRRRCSVVMSRLTLYIWHQSNSTTIRQRVPANVGGVVHANQRT